MDHCVEQLKEVEDNIHKRNKVIKVADSSPVGGRLLDNMRVTQLLVKVKMRVESLRQRTGL